MSRDNSPGLLERLLRPHPRLAGFLGISLCLIIIFTPVALVAWWWIWSSDPHISACQAARQDMMHASLDYRTYPEDEFKYPELYARDVQRQQAALAQFSQNHCEGSIYRLDQSG